jgi:hypothetical protein
MKCEELIPEFERLSREEQKRCMGLASVGVRKEVMSDTAFMDCTLSRCMEIVGKMPEALRQCRREWMGGGKKS